MKVKEWIKYFQTLPEDAEVFSYQDGYDEYYDPTPQFIDMNEEKRKKPKRRMETYASSESHVLIQNFFDYDNPIGVNLNHEKD